MAELNAYLSFKGNCREAMQFYHSCLGGAMNLMTYGESPMAAQMPPEMHGRILHSVLTSGSVMIMGSDMGGEEEYIQGNTLALCLVCRSREEIETLFNKLSGGANVTHPLKEEFFGTYGDLIDKYGFRWMFQYGQAKGKNQE
jgi:PhnB protein